MNTLVSPENAWCLWGIVAGSVALSIWLEQRFRWAAKITGAIIALILAVTLSNLRIIPTEAPVYDVIWDYFVPLALPLLLLKTDLRKIRKESGKMLFCFLIGSVGSATGALVGFALLNRFIPELKGVAGMMTGSYIGGGVNFAALSNTFGVSASMISSATVADNLNMTIYFFLLLSIPSMAFFRKHYKHPHIDATEAQANDSKQGETAAAAYWGRKEISLLDVARCGAAAFAIVAIAGMIAQLLNDVLPAGNVVLDMLRSMLGNKYLWITTISMLCATLKPNFFGAIRGAQELGTYLIYFFLFVIGVPASIPVILQNSPLLLVFTLIMVLCNMVLMFVAGKLTGMDLETIIIASNANIGGPTTAAGMAIAKGWDKLVGPALLVGTLGYVIGTYLGLLVGNLL